MKYSKKDLVEMLTYRRAAGSSTEKKFIKKYIDSISGMTRDSFGNRIIKIGNSDVCFACHTDTVHRTGGRQEVLVDKGWAFKTDKDGCLGGDDTAGIWLCLNMIHARVPGLYIFHRSEETGGQGSNHISKNEKHLLNNINKVISLDRKGYGDVITHQRGRRCCSHEFATELARQLGGQFKLDPTGVFTDSANYDRIVPECTNLSIGYFHAHSPSEIQNLEFVEHLFKRLRKVNWKGLPVRRNLQEETETYGLGSKDFYDPFEGGGAFKW